MNLCQRVLSSRSVFVPDGGHRCHRPAGHVGACDELPFLTHLKRTHPKVAKKIERDSMMTTGAAWKSEDAGPNRTRRWAMLLTDTELEAKGIRMSAFEPQVIAKLREKAATYDNCVAVAQKLTCLAYSMQNSPKPPDEIRGYLEAMIGPVVSGTTTCLICMEPLDFGLFEKARRGKAEIETGHSAPRMHNADNVGFAHRVCNIAQGARTLDQFYAWIHVVLQRVVASGRWQP
jgi:hypothetical protein